MASTSIDYLEGLPSGETTLDPGTIAPAEALRAAVDQVAALDSELTVAHLDDATRQALGQTNTSERLDLAMACQEFATLHPDIAQEAGDPKEHWDVVVDTDLALGDTQAALQPVVMQARVNQAVLQNALTSDVQSVIGWAQTRLAGTNQGGGDAGPPALGDDDRDELRYLVAGFEEDDRQAEAAAQQRKAQDQARQRRAGNTLKAAQQNLDRSVARLALQRGQEPDLSVAPSAAPVGHKHTVH